MGMIKSNVWEIEKEIRLHGHIEWRSKKNLDTFVRDNTFDKNISIVGYITPKTIEKCGLDINEKDNLYVGVRRDKSLCYLLGLGIPTPIDHSFYARCCGL